QLKKQYSLPFITFSHLVKLHLNLAHIDYVGLQYETLSILKINFTNDAARVNCAKEQRLVIKEQYVCPENYH
ncbi:unnamed protein product, partial [Rotaria sp. Silwood2]